MVNPLIQKRKAQSGNKSAILVIIITALLILFILSISPEDREELLNNGNTPIGTDPSFPDSINLIRANPGKINYQPQNEIIHEFAPFNIDASVKGELLHTKNSIYLKNAVFEKITDQIILKITPELTSNVLINFNVIKSSGSLIIKVNGETIFNAPIGPGNSPAISIARSSLKQENIIEFQVSSSGAAFWRYNYYQIENLNIYGDVIDLTKSKSTQSFNVNQKESNEVKTSTLRYLPTCNMQEIKDLKIKINNFEIFSGIPDCQVFNTILVPIQYLYEGINEITFQIDQGKILIDRASLTNNLQTYDLVTYYFEMQDKYFNVMGDDYVLRKNYDSMLDITFPNNDQKRFEILINGKPISFNTVRLRETRNTNLFLQPGTNSIQIKPQSELTITEIRIRIRER